jgi:predicted transcriptional regulator
MRQAKLTGKETEIMATLWNSDKPLTTSEIIDITPDRTWHEGSIFALMKSLVRKGVVALDTYKPTAGKPARVYKPIITTEDYAIRLLGTLGHVGINVDMNVLADRLKKSTAQ